MPVVVAPAGGAPSEDAVSGVPSEGRVEIALAGGLRVFVDGTVNAPALARVLANTRGSGTATIPVPGDGRVWLATGRRGMNTLAPQVQEGLGCDLQDAEGQALDAVAEQRMDAL